MGSSNQKWERYWNEDAHRRSLIAKVVAYQAKEKATFPVYARLIAIRKSLSNKRRSIEAHKRGITERQARIRILETEIRELERDKEALQFRYRLQKKAAATSEGG